MENGEREGGIPPPRYSVSVVFRTLKRKGLVGALNDEEQGPHVHLTLLLITVVVVSLGIIILSKIL